MADTDLIFKLIAQDEAKQKLEEARAAFEKMTESEKESVKASIEAVEADRKLAESKQEVIDKVERLGERMSSIGEKMTIGVTLPLVGIATAATKLASDLSETRNKIDVLFGESSKDIQAWASTAATSLGQSQKQALDAASTFALFGKSAGLAGKDLTEFSEQNVKLASDMASFFNTSPEDAIQAIGAAFRGESEPIRRYNVLIDEASLKQEAVKLGLISTTKDALQPQQRVLAAQALILQQTSAAQGDFIKTSDGLANSSRIVGAQLENTLATLGERFLPIALKGVQAVNSLFEAFQKLPPSMQDAIVAFGALAAATGPVLTISGKIAESFGVLKTGAVDLVGDLLKMGRSVSDVAGTLERVGVTSYTVRDAIIRLRESGALLTGELGLLVAGLVVILKYLDEVGKAAGATNEKLIELSHSGDLFQQAAASTEIMVHGQDRLKETLDAVHKKIKESADGYDDYRSSIEATAKAAGYQIDAQGNLVKVIYGSAGAITTLVEANYALSRAVYEATPGVSGLDKVWRGLVDTGKQFVGIIAPQTAALAEAGEGADTTAARYEAMGNAIVKANTLAEQSIEVLKISMAGAVTKELESFTNKQDDLQKKAEKVREELDKLEKSQGAVATSTKKHGLTAAETTLKQLQLAEAQRELDAENAKGTRTTEELVAAQAKVLENKQKLEGATKKEIENNGQLRAAAQALSAAQSELANNTDPMKQAQLAVKVEDLKGQLGQATGAVVSYVDNSKKIKELQGQYDDLNKEIAENAMEHTKATRQILFNIAAQQLETIKDPQVRAKAMNELALQWQLVDKATYESTTKIIGYVDQLAKDKNIDAFVHNVQGVDSAVRGLPNQIADSVTATKNEMKELKAEPVEVKVGVDREGAKKSLEDTRTELKSQALQGDVVIPVTYKVTTITTDQTAAERDKQQQARDKSATDRIADTGTAAKKVSDDLGVAGKSAMDALGTQATQQEEKVRTTGMNVLQMFKDTTTNFSGLVTNAMNTANLAAGSLLTNILKAEGVHIVEFKVKVTGDEIPRLPSGGGGNIPELQHGGPVRTEGLYRLHPDEYVLSASMRHGQQPIPQQAIPIARGGGDTTINNNNFYDGASTKLWLEKQRLDRVQSVLEAM